MKPAACTARSSTRRHRWSCATSKRCSARTTSPMDLQQWSRVWVEQPGRPTVETILEVKNGSIERLAFRQRDSWNRNLIWPQQLRIAIGGHAPQRIINVELDGREVEVPQV